MENVAKIFTGNSINEKIKQEKYFGKTDGLTYIATKNVGFDNKIDYDTKIKIPESENFKVAPKNTTLLCIEGGSAGKKIGFTNQPVCFVNKLCAFVGNETNSKLIYFFMQTDFFLNQFNAKKHGLIGGVSIKDLSEIIFPLPPLDEQKKIVERIERLFSKLDSAKKKFRQFWTATNFDAPQFCTKHLPENLPKISALKIIYRWTAGKKFVLIKSQILKAI